MSLHKCCGNTSERFLDTEKEYEFSSTDEIKTLRIVWKAKTDCFTTKRSVLSIIARLFDPLGLLGPVIIKAKIFMQQLWLLKIDWVKCFPRKKLMKWQEFVTSFTNLNDINIERCTVIPNTEVTELHGFYDSSEKAYGAAIYARTVNSAGEVKASQEMFLRFNMKDEISLNLTLFEHHTNLTLLPKAQWVQKLLGLIPLKFAHLIAREPEERSNDYVKNLLLQRFTLSPEKLRQLFVSDQKLLRKHGKISIMNCRLYLIYGRKDEDQGPNKIQNHPQRPAILDENNKLQKEDLQVRDLLLEELQEQRNLLRQDAKGNIQNIKAQNKNYDRMRKKVPEYQKGDLVAIQRTFRTD
ncbi:hypothetical protein HNY73_018458 [Argiope bruennichi]|uniref:Uncharacterized protein n=1 Tax=Argiope bruennichi TaxID=94029 RepID=A0A8T0EH11_ARGBR|nr:hypothetical protein HNY73_018458 [Argiope bruennichi]